MGGGKFRHRLKKPTTTRAGGIEQRRWPKGGSSDSNPTTNRHRAAANAMRLQLIAQQQQQIATSISAKRQKKLKSTNRNNNDDEERVVSHIPLSSLKLNEDRQSIASTAKIPMSSLTLNDDDDDDDKRSFVSSKKLEPKPAKPPPSAYAIYTSIQETLPDLLPPLVATSIDMSAPFHRLARVLGAALQSRVVQRLEILSAIRSLIRYTLQMGDVLEGDFTMHRYAKNFMPILFAMYVKADESNARLSVLATIQLYVRVTERSLIATYIDVALKRIDDVVMADGEAVSALSLNEQIRILDLIAAMTRSADDTALSRIFDKVMGMYESRNVHIQKKAFRILEEIITQLNTQPTTTTTFYDSHWQHISNALLMNAAAIASSAQAARLACCRQLLRSRATFDDVYRFARLLAPSIIRCLDTKYSTRTRSNAAKWLIEVGEKLSEDEERSTSTALQSIFDAIYGIANEDGGASCSLLAAAIIAQKYVKQLDATHTSRLIAHACGYVADGCTSIRFQALRLMNIMIRKLPDYALHQFKDVIVTGVFSQLTADVTQRVRRANRRLLETLVERFGVEVVAKWTDKVDWTKQLKSIAKARRKSVRMMDEAKRERAMGEFDNRSMSSGPDTIVRLLAGDDDDERRSMKSVWLEDDDEDEMLDLLDSGAVTKKIRMTAPMNGASAVGDERKTPVFKSAKDGRLIITDLDGNGGGKRRADDDDDDECGKKKLKTATDDDNLEYEDVDDEKASVAKSYRSGGTGIHRDVTSIGNRTFPKKKSHHAAPKRGNAGGDTRKKGQQLQPYAYVPLVLNRTKNKGSSSTKSELRRVTMKGGGGGGKSW